MTTHQALCNLRRAVCELLHEIAKDIFVDRWPMWLCIWIVVGFVGWLLT